MPLQPSSAINGRVIYAAYLHGGFINSRYIRRVFLSFSEFIRLFLSDPSVERIHSNLAIFRAMVKESKADRKLMERYSKKTATKKVKKERKFPKFYYTPEEDHYQRYLLEKTVAKRLCRGETKPIVSC